MTVDPEEKNKLKIYLTDREVERIFGGYGKINYTDPRSKAAIGLLLKEAINSGGFMPQGEKLLIEVRPHGKGCVISFSGKNDDENITLNQTKSQFTYTIHFADSDSLLDGVRELYLNAPPLPDSRLYRIQNTYQLIIRTTKNIAKHLIHINEYCNKISSGQETASYCAEYGQLICSADTVKKIGCAVVNNN